MSQTHSGRIGHNTFIPAKGDAPGWSDADTERTVGAILADMPASHNAYVSVTAHGDMVTLDGTVSDGAWLARLKNRLMSAMPGITLEDRLEWILPDCGIGRA